MVDTSASRFRPCGLTSTRASCSTPRRSTPDYLALFDDPTRFDDLAARENFGAVVLTTAYPDRYLGLIWHLAGSAHWRLTYTDATRCSFCAKALDLRSASAQPSTPSWDELAARFAGNRELLDAARLHLARDLLVVLGQSREAQYVLATLDSRPGRAASRARRTLPPESLGPPRRWLASCFCRTRVTYAAWACSPRSRPLRNQPSRAGGMAAPRARHRSLRFRGATRSPSASGASSHLSPEEMSGVFASMGAPCKARPAELLATNCW